MACQIKRLFIFIVMSISYRVSSFDIEIHIFKFFNVKISYSTKYQSSKFFVRVFIHLLIIVAKNSLNFTLVSWALHKI